MRKEVVLAFLLGVFATLVVQRWISIEAKLYKHEMHINYVEGYLEQATR